MKTIEKYNNRPSLNTMYNVSCGDWHLSWGFGTTNLGRLYWNNVDKYYIYRGHNQGRHGQKWNLNKEIHFTIIDTNNVNIIWDNNKGSLPQYSELFKSIEQIKTLTK